MQYEASYLKEILVEFRRKQHTLEHALHTLEGSNIARRRQSLLKEIRMVMRAIDHAEQLLEQGA